MYLIPSRLKKTKEFKKIGVNAFKVSFVVYVAYANYGGYLVVSRPLLIKIYVLVNRGRVVSKGIIFYITGYYTVIVKSL